MRYRINQIKVDPYKVAGREGGIDKEVLIKELKAAVERSINVKKTGLKVTQVEIVKESIDARKKPNVRLIYSVEFTTDKPIDESKLRVQINLVKDRDLDSKEDNIPVCKNGERPVVVGFGPCGILAGLVLAEAGMNPIIIERGKSVDERVADVESFWARGENPNPESNVQFGEGGAGTFSDGKLVTGIKDKRVRKVFESFVEAGANPEILYKQKPHIGTDKLRDVVKSLRCRIEKLGGQVRFNSKLVGLCIEGNELQGIEVKSTSELTGEDREIEVIDTRMVIMAIGHSARDTFSLMHKLGFDMTQKPFSIGVRIEHPQKMVNLAQYGDEKLADILGPADYKLSYRCQDEEKEATYGRGVYTFCMCPGGLVVNASTEKGTAVTNGMSNSARDGEYANSALLVDVRTTDFGSDHPLAGLEFQRKYEELAYRNMVRAGGSGLPQTTYG
ncbi:MAG: NAD(FAD)-utilizing dehydrogenase, partial [Bacillota bacterium]|nr:NAD(FAD)-utilizing dehydrogenase [Bacillota bacterium]